MRSPLVVVAPVFLDNDLRIDLGPHAVSEGPATASLRCARWRAACTGRYARYPPDRVRAGRWLRRRSRRTSRPAHDEAVGFREVSHPGDQFEPRLEYVGQCSGGAVLALIESRAQLSGEFPGGRGQQHYVAWNFSALMPESAFVAFMTARACLLSPTLQRPRHGRTPGRRSMRSASAGLGSPPIEGLGHGRPVKAQRGSRFVGVKIQDGQDVVTSRRCHGGGN